MKTILTIIALFFTVYTNVVSSEFDDFINNQYSDYISDDIEFENKKKKVVKEFRLYRNKILNEYKLFKHEAEKIWGVNNTPVSDKKTWIRYEDKLQTRKKIDFEKGEVRIEVIGTGSEAKEKLKNAIISIVSNDDSNPAKQSTIKDKDGSKPGILSGQLLTKSGEMVSGRNVKKFASDIVNMPVKTNRIKGRDGKTRKVSQVKFNLLPEHIKIRAKKFITPVDKYAEKYRLTRNLLFSVIETESYFNPMARSFVPAFGLMQLVPHYGAREAYRFIYNKDVILSDTYLYNVNNNIQLGSAYLHVIFFKHMADIQDKNSRMWCSIAAYNTGPTNVYRAIIGKYSRSRFRRYSDWKRKAINKINSMTSEELYKYLRKNLPYKETRNYLLKVRHRMDKYSSL